MKILLVDDERINTLSASLLLGKEGYDVTTAVNGQQALDLLHENEFDCILMDIQMPVMNGLEASAKIRDESVFGEKAKTPIIAITGHTFEDSKNDFKKAEIEFFVSKPFDIENLLQVIKQATSGHKD